MKKIIPFEKDVKFNTNIYEINSISLENTLKSEKNEITGDFIISGDYKESDVLLKTEPFIYNLPFNIVLDEKYDEIKIDIDDFSYEVVGEDTLKVKINVLVNIDLIEEIEPDVIITEKEDEINFEPKIEEDDCLRNEDFVMIDNEIKQELVKEENKIDEELSSDERSIFDNFNVMDESYVTYHVHIFREKDSIEEIMKIYDVTNEDLKEYNDLSKISIGSKIIIPKNE